VISLGLMALLKAKFVDATVLPSPKAGAADVQTPWLIVITASVFSLCNMSGYVAFEAMYSAVLFNEFSVSAASSMPFWVSAGLGMLAVGVTFPKMMGALGARKLMLLGFVMVSYSFYLMVHWPDLEGHISRIRMIFAGVIVYAFMTSSNILVAATLSRALPPALQGKWAGFNQFAGQLGRCVGPVYGTWSYATGEAMRPGTNYPSNFFFIVWAFPAIFSTILPNLVSGPFFAVFDPPPPAAKRGMV